MRTAGLLAFLLHLLPRRWLVACLARAWARPEFAATPTFSGRAAIAELARAHQRAGRALLPEYLCNIVHVALLAEGCQLATYRVDAELEPDLDDVRLQLRGGSFDLVFAVPLLGATGGLAWWLGDEASELLRRSGARLVLDFCQDATLARDACARSDRASFVLLSFNDKSFPGVMGGLVLSRLPFAPRETPLGWKRLGRLYAWWLRKLLRAPAARSDDPAFEYSLGQPFPYECTNFRPAKIQLAHGVAGRWLLPRYLRRRQRALATGRVKGVPRPFAATSPFLQRAPGDPGRNRQKRAYAVHGAPQASLRPDLVVVHNKGFDDTRPAS